MGQCVICYAFRQFRDVGLETRSYSSVDCGGPSSDLKSSPHCTHRVFVEFDSSILLSRHLRMSRCDKKKKLGKLGGGGGVVKMV